LLDEESMAGHDRRPNPRVQLDLLAWLPRLMKSYSEHD
jgi:hypothetical protein